MYYEIHGNGDRVVLPHGIARVRRWKKLERD